LDQWNQVVLTYNGIAVAGYLNSTFNGASAMTGPLTTSGGAVYLGGSCGDEASGSLTGGLANVQVYNVSLSQIEITGLYREGIGGAPIRIQNLVGWWPLNGNAQDYSGNNNNGAISGEVSFNSSWQSAYTPP
jgi:hypothetical protein